MIFIPYNTISLQVSIFREKIIRLFVLFPKNITKML